MFVRGSCLSKLKGEKKCEFTNPTHSVTERYEWLRPLTADRTWNIVDSFSNALRNDASWWVGKDVYFFFLYNQAQLSLDVPCMILSGFRKVLIGNMNVTCLWSSYRANEMHICKLICIFLVFIQPGTQCNVCFIKNICFSYTQDRF